MLYKLLVRISLHSQYTLHTDQLLNAFKSGLIQLPANLVAVATLLVQARELCFLALVLLVDHIL